MRSLPNQLAAIVASDLPKPPAPPKSTDGNTVEVLLIVGAILSVIVLVAWLLKPLVARRLPAPDIGDESVAPPPQWESADGRTWPDVRRADRPEASDAIVTSEIESDRGERDLDATEEDTALQEEPDDTLQEVLSPPLESEADAPSEPAESDTEIIVDLTLTVRELLDHANEGRLAQGFRLYSERFLARFREETGLNQEEFATRFALAPPRPPEARAELAAVTDLENLADGRVSAVVAYANGGNSPAPERYLFIRSETHGRWLIDDILTIG